MLNQTVDERANQAIARGLRNRDPELLSGLIDEHKERLFAFLVSLTWNRDTAEDLFQETWLRVLERGHQYRGEWKFETWLLSIAKNLAIDHMRRKTPLSLDTPAEWGESPPIEPAAPASPTPLDVLRQSEQRRWFHRHFRRLPASCKEVYALRARGLPLHGIAAVLRVPLPTVKSRLYRTVTVLNRKMAACGA